MRSSEALVSHYIPFSYKESEGVGAYQRAAATSPRSAHSCAPERISAIISSSRGIGGWSRDASSEARSKASRMDASRGSSEVQLRSMLSVWRREGGSRRGWDDRAERKHGGTCSWIGASEVTHLASSSVSTKYDQPCSKVLTLV
jgi:hypothetical protein